MLKELRKHFELILFTSSSRIYCDGILKNVIESKEKYFDHKLFKNHLSPPRSTTIAYKFKKENTLIKNLDILLCGRSLSDTILIDNRSANYCEHVFNGIPISDYHGNQNDTALPALTEYLIQRILPADDVRNVIKEDFIDAVLLPMNTQQIGSAQGNLSIHGNNQSVLKKHPIVHNR
jgi:TFIIF-interacting CTD phosphatase-like protein